MFIWPGKCDNISMLLHLIDFGGKQDFSSFQNPTAHHIVPVYLKLAMNEPTVALSTIFGDRTSYIFFTLILA